jgi:hypothetical protein
MPLSTCDEANNIPELVSQASGALKWPRCEDNPRAIPEENKP